MKSFADRQLSAIIERAEARANAAFVEARAAQQPEVQATWIDVGGTYAMFDGPESPITQTFGLGMFSDPTDESLDSIERFFSERGSATNHEVSPHAGVELYGLLNDRGYRPIEVSNVLYRAISPSEIPGAKSDAIKVRIANETEADLWAATSARGWSSEASELEEFMRGFGRISATCKGGFPYLAEIDGVPVATSMLFLFEGIAILAGASTVPEARCRGAQSILLASRLRHAAANGCRIAMMCAVPGSQSQRNAEKNGFRIAYTRTKWMLDQR